MPKQKTNNKIAKQSHALHKRRVGWLAVLIIGLLVIQFAYNMHTDASSQALAYSGNTVDNELLQDSNNYRAANGLPPLKFNAQLTHGAEAKAKDMVAKNYWSHSAPDGSAPWAFFDKAGYKYVDAGENLAYGFSSGNEVVGAWINSPSHRANILGHYTEVGFGSASSPDYQHGNNTVVVAFYGTPRDASASVSSVKGASIAGNSQHINGLNLLFSGAANWALYASFALLGASAIGFVITHLELLRLGWYNRRKLLAIHPVLDAGFVLLVASMLLYAAGGFIR